MCTILIKAQFFKKMAALTGRKEHVFYDLNATMKAFPKLLFSSSAQNK